MYCKYCGKEVSEHAFVCPACGGLLGEIVPVQTQTKEAAQNVPAQPLKTTSQEESGTQTTERKHERLAKLSKTFGILSLSFAGATACILLFATLGGLITQYGTGTESWLSDGVAFVLGWLYSMIFGTLAMGFGVPSFVLGLIQKDSESVKKISTIAFVLGIVLFFLSVSFLFSPIFWL